MLVGPEMLEWPSLTAEAEPDMTGDAIGGGIADWSRVYKDNSC